MRLWWLKVSVRGTSVLQQLFVQTKEEMKCEDEQYNDKNKSGKRALLKKTRNGNVGV